MENTGKEISIGTAGWQHKRWLQDYYPEEMPEEWRLTYYSNEFSRILVPQRDWVKVQVPLSQWADDVHEGFRFYLQVDSVLAAGLEPAQLRAHMLEAREHLGQWLGGFVVRSSAGGNWKKLITDGLWERLPIYLADLSLDEMRSMPSGVGLCWQPGSEVPGVEFSIGILALSDFNSDLRLLRQAIEEFLSNTGTVEHPILFLEGDPPEIELVKQIRILVDLLST